MRQVGIWRIDNEQPLRVKASEIELESKLENWIERDPTLIEQGMQIVARQLTTGHGGRLDLLAIDMQGRWTVIELKPSYLYREALAQALDYAACVAEMSPDRLEGKANEYLEARNPGGSVTLRALLDEAGSPESLDAVPRDVQIILVGTGRSSDLERVIGFLERSYEAPAKTVTFQVFEPEPGRKILLRELRTGERGPTTTTDITPPVDPLEKVRRHADEAGTRELLEDYLEAGEELGLHRRPWGRSVMFAPQEDKRLCLFTLWVDTYKDGTVRLWVDPARLAEFFPVSEEKATEVLGENRPERVTQDVAKQMLGKVRALLTEGLGDSA